MHIPKIRDLLRVSCLPTEANCRYNFTIYFRLLTIKWSCFLASQRLDWVSVCFHSSEKDKGKWSGSVCSVIPEVSSASVVRRYTAFCSNIQAESPAVAVAAAGHNWGDQIESVRLRKCANALGPRGRNTTLGDNEKDRGERIRRRKESRLRLE